MRTRQVVLDPIRAQHKAPTGLMEDNRNENEGSQNSRCFGILTLLNRPRSPSFRFLYLLLIFVGVLGIYSSLPFLLSLCILPPKLPAKVRVHSMTDKKGGYQTCDGVGRAMVSTRVKKVRA